MARPDATVVRGALAGFSGDFVTLPVWSRRATVQRLAQVCAPALNAAPFQRTLHLVSQAKERVLVVDDDVAVGKVLAALLGQAGFEARATSSAREAVELLRGADFAAVLTDVRMPEMDGLELLSHVREAYPGMPVVLVSAHGTVPMAVEAMRRGAASFLMKPFDKAEIVHVLKTAILAASAEPAREVGPVSGMVGDAPAFRDVLALVKKAAQGSATVLVRGETGTGKELVARALHESGPRRDKPFVRVHCAALPANLLESELFGHEKGAFTGAIARKPGRFELAHTGTLFLDEIGDITPETQVKLLRVLQERELERVGGTETIRVDVRFVAATHRDLEAMVRAGQFREDLFYRLSVVPIVVPPLRERAGDVVRLAQHFVRVFGERHGRPGAKLTQGALERLTHEAWPGNVRQLENFVERLVVLADQDDLDEAAVGAELRRATAPGITSTSAAPPPPGDGASLEASRQVAEREALVHALERAKGNRTLAARLLNVSRRTLYNKMAELGVG
ncbi:MAG: sigma-54-dependent Fis family transcriptional regulator [Myxococcales bacterium]|nr:sigma-54-dependent Fis family transcriptional regulator [Myxococcales bacterium]